MSGAYFFSSARRSDSQTSGCQTGAVNAATVKVELEQRSKRAQRRDQMCKLEVSMALCNWQLQIAGGSSVGRPGPQSSPDARLHAHARATLAVRIVTDVATIEAERRAL